MSETIKLVLTHLPPETAAAALAAWSEVSQNDSRVVVAYGGAHGDFDALEAPDKFFVADPRLRTGDHQRECQSYAGVLQAAAKYLHEDDYQYLLLVEFDHWPVVGDLCQRLKTRLTEEKADVLGHWLQRIDGTSHPHYLQHAAFPGWRKFWDELSVRRDPSVVLSMLGSGSFWKREALEAVAAVRDPFPMYLELHLPTMAHHLGFRLRDLADQNLFVRNLGDFEDRIFEARSSGAWTVHPIKELRPGHLPQLLETLRRDRPQENRS